MIIDDCLYQVDFQTSVSDQPLCGLRLLPGLIAPFGQRPSKQRQRGIHVNHRYFLIDCIWWNILNLKEINADNRNSLHIFNIWRTILNLEDISVDRTSFSVTDFHYLEDNRKFGGHYRRPPNFFILQLLIIWRTKLNLEDISVDRRTFPLQILNIWRALASTAEPFYYKFAIFGVPNQANLT